MAMLAEIVTTDDLLATLDRHTLKQPPLTDDVSDAPARQ
jgi:hypothetical protein